ncbi:MAG: hypothetical protein R3Y35_05990 [Clostridia bacterium]
MNKKSNNCAVIEIGSNDVKMGIFENSKDGIHALDRLSYPVTLGHEIFNNGQVNFATLNELNNILSRYKLACNDFGIKDITVVSTTVMREAGNSNIIADRVKIKNGLDINVLTDNKEKSLIYSHIIHRLLRNTEKPESAIMVYIGSGSMGLACFDGKHITNSYNIPIGALKLNDMLGSLRKKSTDYNLVVEEYLHSIFSKLNIDFSKYKSLVLTGSEMNHILNIGKDLENDAPSFISYNTIKTIYKSVKSLTAENIGVKYGISEEHGEILSTTLSISYTITKFMSKSSKIIISPVDLARIVANHNLNQTIRNNYQTHILESSIKSATLIAKRYNCNPVHYNSVKRISCQLFDKLKKVHGLDMHYRHILEIASIVHSSGSYVNTRHKSQSSFDLIKNLEIYGVSQDECKIIAYLSSYNDTINLVQENIIFANADMYEEVIISKLIALFRLANALDKSQKDKLSINNMKIHDNELIITASCEQDSSLEQWAFEECASYFSALYGIKPRIVVKSNLI